MRAAVAAVLFSLAILLSAGAAVGQEPDIRITQLQCNTDPEAVTIKNLGETSQDLSGWQLRSDPVTNSGQVFDLSAVGALDPSEQATVFSYTNAPATDAASGIYRWALNAKFRNNDPTDFAQLVDGQGNVVDQLNCGQAPPGTEQPTDAPTASATLISETSSTLITPVTPTTEAPSTPTPPSPSGGPTAGGGFPLGPASDDSWLYVSVALLALAAGAAGLLSRALVTFGASRSPAGPTAGGGLWPWRVRRASEQRSQEAGEELAAGERLCVQVHGVGGFVALM